MAKTIEIAVVEGKTKDGRNYTAADIKDQDGTVLTRIFLKPTEYQYYAQVVGKYQAVESNK